jgi:hypothetical protein
MALNKEQTIELRQKLKELQREMEGIKSKIDIILTSLDISSEDPSNVINITEILKAIDKAKQKGKYYNISTGRTVANNTVTRKSATLVWYDEFHIAAKKGDKNISRVIPLLKKNNTKLQTKPKLAIKKVADCNKNEKFVLKNKVYGDHEEEVTYKLVLNSQNGRYIAVGIYDETDNAFLPLSQKAISYAKTLGFKVDTKAELPKYETDDEEQSEVEEVELKKKVKKLTSNDPSKNDISEVVSRICMEL